MSIDFNDHAVATASDAVTLLPDPPRKERYFTVVSVDDHLVEPPDLFDGRMPAKYADRAPRVVPHGRGESWLYDGILMPNAGLNAVIGRQAAERSIETTSFDHLRRGAWSIEDRIRDMDLDGVYASLNFPTRVVGIGGDRLQTATSDLELGLAAVRAYNNWQLEEWAGANPDRIIPLQIAWLHDPVVAAAEIRANAARGYHALTFPEAPHKLGFPSIYSDFWDPLFAACVETSTAICLHVGSSGGLPPAAPDAPLVVPSVLSGIHACGYTVEWLFSPAMVRNPELRICISEGGLGWVAGLMDRLDHMTRHQEVLGNWKNSLTPVEVLHRSFTFCAVDDPSSFKNLERIGPENVVFEVGYPHSDSSWPNTQRMLLDQLEGLSVEHVEAITWRNAARLFDFTIPESVRKDPNSF